MVLRLGGIHFIISVRSNVVVIMPRMISFYLSTYLTILLMTEHASHVIMSVVKLLSRIVTPSNGLAQAQENANVEHEQLIKSLHDKTYVSVYCSNVASIR